LPGSDGLAFLSGGVHVQRLPGLQASHLGVLAALSERFGVRAVVITGM
jgi:hypothetical protein